MHAREWSGFLREDINNLLHQLVCGDVRDTCTAVKVCVREYGPRAHSQR